MRFAGVPINTFLFLLVFRPFFFLFRFIRQKN